MAHLHCKKLHYFLVFKNNIAPSFPYFFGKTSVQQKTKTKNCKAETFEKQNGLKGIINRRGVLLSEQQKALYQPIAFQNVNILLSIIISKNFSAEVSAQKSL